MIALGRSVLRTVNLPRHANSAKVEEISPPTYCSYRIAKEYHFLKTIEFYCTIMLVLGRAGFDLILLVEMSANQRKGWENIRTTTSSFHLSGPTFFLITNSPLGDHQYYFPPNLESGIVSSSLHPVG